VSAQRFEITADDIAKLNDVDLRTLVGLLCESEARRRGRTKPSIVVPGGNATRTSSPPSLAV
jgi:hypothetical protein